MGRIAALLGGTRTAWVASLLVSSLTFGVLHLYQGLAGVLMTGVVGLLLGGLYLITGRNLWIVIMTHGLMNSAQLMLLYLGLG